jgi:hypothetical protein
VELYTQVGAARATAFCSPRSHTANVGAVRLGRRSAEHRSGIAWPGGASTGRSEFRTPCADSMGAYGGLSNRGVAMPAGVARRQMGSGRSGRGAPGGGVESFAPGARSRLRLAGPPGLSSNAPCACEIPAGLRLRGRAAVARARAHPTRRSIAQNRQSSTIRWAQPMSVRRVESSKIPSRRRPAAQRLPLSIAAAESCYVGARATEKGGW